MLSWATVFVVLAIIAGVFGLTDLSSEPGTATRTMVFAFLGLGLACVAMEYLRGSRRP